MSLLRSLRNPYRQPPPGSEVDLQHPLGHGCVGWWEANMGSGLVVPDISGQDNHGTMTNMDASTDWVQGRHGGEGALEFDGATNYVDLQTTSSVDYVTLVVVARCADSNRDDRQLLTADVGGGGGEHRSWQFRLDGNSGLLRFILFIAGGIEGLASANAYDDGDWHTFAATYDGVTAYIYVDGIQVGSDNTGGGVIDTGGPLLIGSRTRPGDWYIGQIASSILYSRALPAEEIADLRANPYAPIWTPGERKWWWMGAAGGAYYYDHITRRIRGLI